MEIDSQSFETFWAQLAEHLLEIDERYLKHKNNRSQALFTQLLLHTFQHQQLKVY